MKTGRRAVLLGMMGVIVGGVLPALPARSEDGFLAAGAAPLLLLDFGGTTPAAAPGYQRVLSNQLIGTITAARPWGWVNNSGIASRDRNLPAVDTVFRDFIFAPSSTTTPPPAARVFRIGFLTPGRYRVSILTGDRDFGDHTTRVSIPGVDGGQSLPVLKPDAGEYATLTATFVIPAGKSSVDITFDTPEKNWVVSALILESATEAERARVTIDIIPPAGNWGPILTSEDPTAPLLSGHRSRAANSSAEAFTPTGLSRPDYLALIAGEIDFWKNYQNTTTGAIIDPYRGVEFQYSTPAFAHAAATLVAYAGRADLLDAAALALDWSAKTLSARKAASGHEDFFAPMIAHAIRLLKPFVPNERSAKWEYDIWFFEPFLVYRYGPGVNNWNVVAASGEALFQMMGIRDASHKFVQASFARQGSHFNSPYGLYLEGPMAYDHFPRLWVADLMARGYSGPYSSELNETLRRASITSLFMQSPSGELPAGGRSAHHQWNEAEQCVTFEIYSARALAAGDTELASIFKRAAHLSLGSMRRWVRPSGEMQIVKNWVDPSQQHGYETYSAHSQYNLLPMSMLAIAYEHAETTEGIAEKPAPADTGGYVLEITELNKVFANAGGSYVELETGSDSHYDATGLIRVHFAGNAPQLGPSDSLLTTPSYLTPANSPVPITTGIGVSWQGEDGVWRHQGELQPSQLQSVSVQATETTAEQVAFSVRYEGNLGGGLTVIEDQFVLTSKDIQLTTVLPGYTGPIRRVIPLLADDGRAKSRIDVNGGKHIRVSQNYGEGNFRQTFRVDNAATVTVGEELYPNHNGWARLAVAEYPASTEESNGNGKKGKKKDTPGVTLQIKPQGDELSD